LRQSAHGCAILDFLNTVLGLGGRLDLLEELDMEAVVVVSGVDSVDTHAFGVVLLRRSLMYKVVLELLVRDDENLEIFQAVWPQQRRGVRPGDAGGGAPSAHLRRVATTL
jgi:hypothetical protein